MNDFELIQGCIKEDKAAWDAFVDKFSRLIYSTIHHTIMLYGRPRGQCQIKDIFQDIFVSIMENDYKVLKDFKGRNGCKFSSYLSTITVRKVIDSFRKLNKDCLYLDVQDENVLLEQSNRTPSVYETLEQAESAKLTEDLLSQLREEEASLFRMVFYQQKSPSEIAKEFGISVDYFYVLKKRILNKLKTIAEQKQIQI